MTRDIEEDYIFEKMPDFNLDWGNKDIIDQEENRASNSKGEEYDSLQDELIDKLNPGKFKDAEYGLFDCANEIYGKLMNSNSLSDYELRSLRNRAIEELGIHFSSSGLYNRLKSVFDPDNYTVKKPYDKELVENAGYLYNELKTIKDDVRALERLEKSSLAISIQDEYDYLKLPAEEYMRKHPNGKYYNETQKKIEEELTKMKEEDFKKEEEYFKKMYAYEYLEKYPNGSYSREATCFIKSSPGTYLNYYPKGRYASDARQTINARITVAVFVVFLLLIAAIVAYLDLSGSI